MHPIASNIRPILILSGVITSSMIVAVFAPDWALQTMFGDQVFGPLAAVIVRSWGALVGLVGAGLIYAAFEPSARRPAILLAVVSKTSFLLIIVFYGSQYLSKLAISMVFDAIVVVVLLSFLLIDRGNRSPQ